MPRLALALGLLAAGCAPSAPLAPDPAHPASPDAPATASAVAFAALAPVPAPDVPAALRPDGRAPMAHAGHAHAGHGAPPARPEAHAAPAPLADALDAYLALHDALASDRTDAGAARRFVDAFAALADAPPSGDPHFWHVRHADVATVRLSAAALADAADLDAARAAFGTLSAPFAALAEAAGLPDGYDLDRHTCGMTDAPEGGVWLQRAGEPRNPYFGSAMLLCSRGGEGLPTHDHGAHGDGR